MFRLIFDDVIINYNTKIKPLITANIVRSALSWNKNFFFSPDVFDNRERFYAAAGKHVREKKYFVER